MTLSRDQSPQSSMGRGLKGSGVASNASISERTVAASRDAKDNRDHDALGPELPASPPPRPQAKGPGTEQIRLGDLLRAMSSPTLLTFISSGNGNVPSSKQTMSKAGRELSPSPRTHRHLAEMGALLPRQVQEHLENTELPGLFILNYFFSKYFHGHALPSSIASS